MIYLKSYCYSQHELPFVIANLIEGWDYINKYYLYEYNYTHTGIRKEYEFNKVIDKIPEKYREKLVYKMIDLTEYHINTFNDENMCHKINEPIQRSYFFNDDTIVLKDDDIIIDIDVDEIIYNYAYPLLLKELLMRKTPLSIRLNQFFFKHTYLWSDCNFSSPTIYQYSMVKNRNNIIKGIKIKYLRDLQQKTTQIYGCHMSWVMPINNMIKKLYSSAHIKYRHLADKDILEKAINDKIYLFDTNRAFNINELELNDKRIPIYLQEKNIFAYNWL